MLRLHLLMLLPHIIQILLYHLLLMLLHHLLMILLLHFIVMLLLYLLPAGRGPHQLQVPCRGGEGRGEGEGGGQEGEEEAEADGQDSEVGEELLHRGGLQGAVDCGGAGLWL